MFVLMSAFNFLYLVMFLRLLYAPTFILHTVLLFNTSFIEVICGKLSAVQIGING